MKIDLEMNDFKVRKLKQREKGFGWGAERKTNVLKEKINSNTYGMATNLIIGRYYY